MARERTESRKNTSNQSELPLQLIFKISQHARVAMLGVAQLVPAYGVVFLVEGANSFM